MRKGAVILILAFIDVIRVVRAEFLLVAIRPVKLLNPIMRVLA